MIAKFIKLLQVFNFCSSSPIGYLITEVISSNIALSLGMVGALSIVRFRTPVKSPLELVNYFMLITIGIVLNANPNYAINFCIYLAVATLVFKLCHTV